MQSSAMVAIAALVAGSLAGSAAAQINNRPYDFPGGGGPGMSVAGRQAIIIHEIAPAFSPNFLIRGADGGLLFVVPNPGDDEVPLVFGADGAIIPTYHRGFDRNGVRLYGAGIFNPYFAGYGGDGYSTYAANFGPDSISVWTARVTGGYAPDGDAIDDWTAAAHMVGPAF